MSDNNLYTIGIEEEYMLCDPKDGNLVNRAYDIMDNIPGKLKDRFSYELLESEIESNTDISKDVSESLDSLMINRNILSELGKKLNYNIGISGTHPTALSKDQIFIKNDSYNYVSEELKYYASKNITFSTHVHIGLNDFDQVINVTNIARRWIAPLLAISSNSPFFEGNLTGMKSSRTFQFGLFPRTNIPDYINSIDDYKILVKNLKSANTINKSRQIWWKIRPHLNYRTVEFRMCDVQRSLSNTKLIVSLIQALVHRIVNDSKFESTNYNKEYLNDSLWKASSKGFDCLIIDPFDNEKITMKDMIDRLIDYVSPSLKYFNTYDCIDTLNNIINNGTECDNQLDVYNKHGFNGLKKYLMDNVEYSL